MDRLGGLITFAYDVFRSVLARKTSPVRVSSEGAERLRVGIRIGTVGSKEGNLKIER